MATKREMHMATPGEWPADFPFNEDGDVEEGLVVWSRLEIIEGRTTGNRRRCETLGCPGWFIGVNWESENSTRYPCSKGWTYNPITKIIQITDGGEISARAGTTPPPGTNPTPRYDWPDRSVLNTRWGWRVTGTDLVRPPL